MKNILYFLIGLALIVLPVRFAYCYEQNGNTWPADYYGAYEGFVSYVTTGYNEFLSEGDGYHEYDSCLGSTYDGTPDGIDWYKAGGAGAQALIYYQKPHYACTYLGTIWFYEQDGDTTGDEDQDGIPNKDDVDSADTKKKYFGTPPPNRNPNCRLNQVADPINIFNGNLYDSQEDLSFASPFTGGLTFQRSYNSRSSSSSPMGIGWTHSYDIKLNPAYSGSDLIKEVTGKTGRGIYFQGNTQNNVAQGAFSENSSITFESNTYTWTKDDGSVLVFDSTGQLLSITDKNENIQTLTYDTTSGLLDTVTDQTSGRTLTFHYNADSRIDHITGPVTTAVPDGIWVSYQYDTNGNLTRVTYADGSNGSGPSGFEYRYEDPNDPNNLTAKYDLAGHLISTWSYDDQDRAVANVNREGKGATINYDDPSNVVVTDAYGIASTYEIAEIAGRKKVLSRTGPTGCNTCSTGIFRTEFDPETGYPTEREFANGRIDLYQDYDADGNPGTRITASGTDQEETITTTWHPTLSTPLTRTTKSLLADEANPGLSRVLIRDYDDPATPGDTDTPNEAPTNLIHRLILQGFTRDAAGSITPFEQRTFYTYNDSGQILSVNGPVPGDEDTITFAYDPGTGDLLSVTRPLAGTTTFTHDAAGNIISVTDENQVRTQLTLDGRGRVTASTSDSYTETFQYTAAGTLSARTDRSGRTWVMAYNTQGFLRQIADPQGNTTFQAYDENGNLIESSIFSPQGIKTLFKGWDYGDPASDPDLAPGKPARAITRNHDDTASLETLFAYEHGNLTRVTDPAGTQTTISYDLFNRISGREAQQTDTTTAETAYDYDRAGNLIQVTDAEGRITRFAYDDAGRRITEDSPDTGTTRYLYDDGNRLTQKIANDGTAVSYTYDALGRQTGIQYPDAGQDVLFFYDQGINGKGRLTGISHERDAYAFSYDTAGNLVTVDRTTNQATFTTRYDYDPAGRLTAMVYPDGRQVDYELDTAGNISRVTTQKEGISQVLAENVTYRPFGPLAAMTLGSGQQVSRTFDLNYAPVTLSAPSVLENSLAYDPAGRISSITDLLDSSRTQSFGYDRAGRLVSAQGAYGNLAYAYDRTGNRTSRTLDQDITTYTYTAGTSHLTGISGPGSQTDITYDPNGRPLTRGDLEFAYTDAGRLASVTASDTILARYLYNVMGQRTRKTSGDKTTLFHYDLQGNLIGESTPSGDFFLSYVYLNNTRLAALASDPDDVFEVSVSASTGGALEGIRVYAFNASGSYAGIYAVTDAAGLAVFQKSLLSGTAYTFRADYLNEHFWTPLTEVSAGRAVIVVQEVNQTVSVIQNSHGVAGIKVYVFDENNRYLGLYDVTDASGQVRFTLPQGQDYIFRADIMGEQFFSETVTASGEETAIDSMGGILTFALTKGESQPLAGIKTYVFSGSGTYLGRSAVTDSQGVARFDLPSGSYKIRCDYLGNRFWSQEITMAQSTGASLDIPHRQVSLSAVRTLGSESQAAADIKTYLFSESGSYLGISRTTDSSGQAVFSLPERPFKIRGDYLGGQYWSPVFTWTDPAIAIPQGQAVVTVTRAGKPLAGITVYAFDANGSYLGLNTETDAQGRAAFVLPQGSYTFRADDMGSQYWSQSLAVAPDQDTLADLSAGGGTLTLTATDGQNILGGIKTYLFNSEGTYLGSSAVTDAQGRAAFVAGNGEYKIRLDYLGYQFWSDPVTLSGDAAMDVAIPHAAVTASVTTASGGETVPLDGIKVYLFTEAGTYMGMSVNTDAQGHAAFTLPERAYKIRADFLGGQYWSDPFTGTDPAVHIPAGKALVRVGSEASPAAGVKVYVFNGTTYMGRNAVTDSQGIAAFDLPQGTWRFRADYLGSQYWGEGPVLPDQDNTVEIDPENTSLALTLEKGPGSPLAGVKVYAFTDSGTYLGLNGTSDGTGRIVFDLPRGDYKFRSDYLGYKYWTDVLSLPQVSSHTLAIPHTDVAFTVQGQYADAFALQGVKTYLFTGAGTYMGLSSTTDTEGRVIYSLPEQSYKVRADYLEEKYWSQETAGEDRSIVVEHGGVAVQVTRAGTPIAGARVYVFSGAGAYLGQSVATDGGGAAAFTLPVNIYKLRIDYSGSQYWTDGVELIEAQAVSLDLDLDALATNLTADPYYARYDGEMPKKEEPSLLLASVGSLAGYDTAPEQPGTLFYINDHLGTPVRIIDADNQVVWDGVYMPFGMVQDGVGLAQNSFRFPGQYADGESGLYYNWHRYYDPQVGRYLTPDPIGLAGGINPFVYVESDPINYKDPLGLLTNGEGFNLSVSAFGANANITFLTVEDDHGNFGLAISTAFGGAAEIIAGSAQWVFSSTTTAETINDLNGNSGVVSAGIGEILGYNYEAEYGPGYIGESHMFGLDLGVVPINLTGGVSDTKVYNFKKILDDFFDYIFVDDGCH